MTFICPIHGPLKDEEVAYESQSQMPYCKRPRRWGDGPKEVWVECGKDVRPSELEPKIHNAMREVGIAK